MLEIIKSIIMALILAGVCAIGAYMLKARKQQMLETVIDLVQKAEQAVQGSGMGAEKKGMVVAQLAAMGITVTDNLSKTIDIIVKWLNKKSAWYVNGASAAAAEAVKTITE